MNQHPSGLKRILYLTLLWAVILSPVFPRPARAWEPDVPPPPAAPRLTLALHAAEPDAGSLAPLQPSGIFPGYILGIEATWESENLHDENLTFTARVTYPSPETVFYEDDTFKLTWDATYVDNCTHDAVNHVIECTGAFPPSDPSQVLSTHVTFYVEGTCSLYPDPPAQLTVAGTVTYSDGDPSNVSEPVPVAPPVDLTVLPDAPADGGTDVVIQAADGSGPVLQWHDQTAGLVCGPPSGMDPEHHDITYGAYLHKAGQPLQEEDAIGDQDGECSRQIQLLPTQLSCDENGDPQEWEWIVAALDVKYAPCTPTPLHLHTFRFTTASCQPTVDEVRVQYGDKYFLQNVGVENQFDVRMDWNGPAYQTPPDEPIDGTVYFEVNGERKPPDGLPGDLQGARTTFDMGQDWKAGWDGGGNVVKIWAEYRPVAEGPLYRSEMENVTPLVFPFPAWATQVNLGPFSADLGEGVVEYENQAAYPNPAFEASVDVPRAVPYLGGKKLGILESQATASVNASSSGEGKLGLDGQTGLGLGAFNIVGELGGEGQFRFQMGDGLRMEKAKLKLAISTPFKKEMTLSDLIPAVKAAEEWWWVGDLIKKIVRTIVVEGSVTPKIGIEADFVQQGRDDWVFEGSVARGELELKVTATFKPYEKLWVQVYGGGTPFLEFNFPANPDYFRRMGIQLDFGALLHAWRWEKEFKYGVTCALPGGCSSDDDRVALLMADGGWMLMGREYVTADYNTFIRHTRPLATTSTAETPLIANVYPLTEPTLAVRADGHRTLAYITDDPAKPVGQGEELVVLQSDGAGGGWTAPLTLTNDLQLDFAPQAAYDGAGNAVIVWERTYTDAVTSGLNLTFTQQMDIAAAAWFSDTATWSAVTMLTEDDGRLDHSPRLRAGADGSLMTVWQTSDGTNIMGTPDHPITYTYATWDGAAQTWSAPQAAVGGLTGTIEMDVAVYSVTQAALVYAVDSDGLLTTTFDAELYYSLYDGGWAAPIRLTNDAITDTTPSLVYDDAGRLQLLWLRGGDLMMLDDSWDVADARIVRADSGAGGFHALSLSRSPDGHLALLWQGINGNTTDLAYTVYDADAGRWGVDQHLMADDALETALSLAFGADGTLHLAYRKTATEYVTRTVTLGSGENFTVTNVPQPGASALYFLSHRIGRDLTVSDLAVTPADPTAGDPVTLTARVHNVGDLEAGPVVVRFDVGATPIVTVTAAPTLTAGLSLTVAAAWTAPSPLTAPHTLRAVVDPAGVITETFEDNNAAEAVVFSPRLVADDAARLVDSEAATYTLSFHNAGSSPADAPITVTLRAGDPDGMVLGAAVVTTEVAAGAPASATVVVTDLDALSGLSEGWLVVGAPTPGRQNGWPVSLALGPDLTVTGFEADADDEALYVRVENGGPITAAGAALTVWRDVDAASLAYTDTLVRDGTIVYSDALPLLAPGAAVTVGLGLPPDYAAELWALADSHNVLTEIDETNNLAIRGAPSSALCVAPTGVSISGSTDGYTDTWYTFAATVVPTDVTPPLTYVWTPTPRPGSLLLPEGSVVTYTWDAPGSYAIIVTASGCGATVSATHAISIRAPAPFSVYLPLVLRNYEPLVFPANTRYVKRYGSSSGDCSTPETACATIQDAVDVAEAGDLIAIAGYEEAYAFPGDPDGNPRWTYWATESRPKPSGYYGPDNVTQVVLIDKSLTLRGGYDADFTTHAPETYKTVIRPGLSGGAGRGILIAPFAAVTLENLIILEGSAWHQGGVQIDSYTYDGGGGVYGLGVSYRSDALVVRDCTIAGNVASSGIGYGGGVYLDGRPDAVLEGNDIYGNLASTGSGQYSSEGGGVYVRYSDRVRLVDNRIYDNVAATRSYALGGGISLYALTDPTIQGNQVISNAGTLDGERSLGGGLYLWDVTGGIVAGNVISGNLAGGTSRGAGGGLSAYESEGLTIGRNLFYGNVAARAGASDAGSNGGGVRLGDACFDIVLENNIIVRNQSPYGGSGVFLDPTGGEGVSVSMYHNTIADNGLVSGRAVQALPTGGSGDDCGLAEVCQMMRGRPSASLAADVPQEAQGIMAAGTVELTAVNNIIAGHTRGVFDLYPDYSTLAFDHTLWHGNTTDADATVSRTNDLYGDPAFIGPVDGDYHIGAGSAARDAGASAGVSADFDGDPRDAQPDVGADEYR